MAKTKKDSPCGKSSGPTENGPAIPCRTSKPTDNGPGGSQRPEKEPVALSQLNDVARGARAAHIGPPPAAFPTRPCLICIWVTVPKTHANSPWPGAENESLPVSAAIFIPGFE